MKYSLNDYLPRIKDHCTRLEIYPNKELAAKVVAEYKHQGIKVIPVYQVLCNTSPIIPCPDSVMTAMIEYAENSPEGVLFVGIDAYLALIRTSDKRDFFIGIRRLLESQKWNAHFLVSSRSVEGIEGIQFDNPKYEGSISLIRFAGQEQYENLDIQLMPSKWLQKKDSVKILVDALCKMGNYMPEGLYRFTMREMDLPSGNYGNVTVVRDASEALSLLYGVEADFTSGQADTLLQMCSEKGLSPIDTLIICFGGETYLNCEKAPAKLFERRNDELWDLYIWLLKSRIKQNTYLYRVLQQPVTPDNFLQKYVVDTAKTSLRDENAKALAEERAAVLMKMNTAEPLIAKFVSETENDVYSILFMNCGTGIELQGFIRRAAKLDLSVGLPDEFAKNAPLLEAYLSPYFDYGNEQLTNYFTELRRFRIMDNVDDAFVQKAYVLKVPKGIEKRDPFIAQYNDDETALLVVDGMGAEYYPLLINLAKLNNLQVVQKQIVSVNLPTSTVFNRISWPKDRTIQSVRRADNILHDGSSKYEACSYEENLAEVLLLFQKTILPRIISGLNTYKRVIVTADHGSSYLAVTAYRKGLIHTISWANPDDWRYTGLRVPKETSDELEAVYHPESQMTYYVVRGYNRFPKSGGKPYGLHGGATLEERLVPFVVFSNNNVQASVEPNMEEFTENEAFEFL